MATDQHSITLNGRTVAYRIRQSRQVKRIGLRVTDDGLTVAMPKRAKAKAAEKAITDNTAWVLKHMQRLEDNARLAYITVDGFPAMLFKGVETPVRCAPHLKRVAHEDDTLIIRDTLKTPHKALDDWLRQQCLEALTPSVARAEEHIGKRHTRLSIRDQKSRWGSCSNTGTLSFNWRLIMAPPDVLDYVACHEVMHLAVPNHSAKFWNGVAAICPHTETARHWLTTNQHRLMIDLARLLS